MISNRLNLRQYIRNAGRLCLVLLTTSLLAPWVAADVFPPLSGDKSHGQKEALYMVIRDVSAPALTANRIAQIRTAEIQMREFFAEQSGGALDIKLTSIVDVPLALNSGGTRPNNWRALAESYVQTQYGLNAASYHSNVFDVNATTADPNQGWAGLFWGGTNDVAIQSDVNSNFGKLVFNHELGHRVGAAHSGAWRAVDNDAFTPYVWSASNDQYEIYNSSVHGYESMPYGVRRDEYGNPFDVMGNISNGAIRVREKRDKMGWLTNQQVANLTNLGEGTYKLYAHNELSSVIGGDGIYGVIDTYNPNALYGLTYDRTAQRFNSANGIFENYTQKIDLEYRVNDNGAGRDGVQFYLDGDLLDLDAEGALDRNNRERELEVGRSIDDVEFGMSIWDAGDAGSGDFLSFNPPAPANARQLRPESWRFDVLATGIDAIGSFIELAIALSTGLNGIPGDVNQNGYLDPFDIVDFRDGWLSDTSQFDSFGRYARGDLNLNGRTDLADWVLLRQAFTSAGLGAVLANANVPEPSSGLLSATLAGVVLLVNRPWRTKR